jgi:hypothetical protein
MRRFATRSTSFTIIVILFGCAAVAKRPDTPAARIDDRQFQKEDHYPDIRYYLMVFGSENQLRQPKYTHTWASIVTVTYKAYGEKPSLRVDTISWMPKTLDIKPESLKIEEGINLDLENTLRWVESTKQKISMWGPYEVWSGFAKRFFTQKDFMESGQMGYQCVDTIGEAARTGKGCNCIHAITDMDPRYARFRYPLAYYGEAASAQVVRRFMHSPVIIDPPKTHDWIIEELDLNRYKLNLKEYRGRAVPYKPGGDAGLSVVDPLDVINPLIPPTIPALPSIR